jgi:hypothetical protein
LAASLGSRRNHFPSPRRSPETRTGYQWHPDQTTGCDHAGIHLQLILPPVSPEISGSHAAASPLVLMSAGRADVCVTGTYHYQSSYFPMTNPVNVAIYAFGGFMLLALAIGFFAAPG